MTLNTLFALALHHASLCCLRYGVKGTHRLGTRDRSPTSRNMFPMVRGDTLPVTSARITAVFVRLFTIYIRTILRSSLAVVWLEVSVPGLLGTQLVWVHLVTTRSAVIVHSANCLSHLSVGCSHVFHANYVTFLRVGKVVIICSCTSSGYALLFTLPETYQ